VLAEEFLVDVLDQRQGRPLQIGVVQRNGLVREARAPMPRNVGGRAIARLGDAQKHAHASGLRKIKLQNFWFGAVENSTYQRRLHVQLQLAAPEHVAVQGVRRVGQVLERQVQIVRRRQSAVGVQLEIVHRLGELRFEPSRERQRDKRQSLLKTALIIWNLNIFNKFK
jgi:hypothetical protein